MLDHLAFDGAAGFGFPFPDFGFEFLAREVAAVEDAFGLELAGDDISVAIPAWSVPGSQRVESPIMRR